MQPTYAASMAELMRGMEAAIGGQLELRARPRVKLKAETNQKPMYCQCTESCSALSMLDGRLVGGLSPFPSLLYVPRFP